MDKRIHKQNKEEFGVFLEKIVSGLSKGIGGLFGFIIDMERRGESEYAEEGEITGKTKTGKEVRGWYGLRAKIGLDSLDFTNARKRKINQSKPAATNQHDTQ